MKFFAHFLSWVFLPLFTPIYALLIVFFIPSTPSSFFIWDSLYYYPPEAKLLYLLLFLVFIVLAPGLSMLVLKLNGSISSLDMPKREERKSPIIIMLFYTIVLYLFILFQQENNLVHFTLKGMALGGVVASALALIINYFEKISLHGIGLGALIGFIYSYFIHMDKFNIGIFLLIIVLSGLTLSARLFLKLHTNKEILLGVLVGFGTQFFCIFFYP